MPRLNSRIQQWSPAAQRALVDELLRNDLTSFIRRTFETVAPGEELKLNWHIKAIAHSLEQVMSGDCKRLIIAMPPRALKSISISVAFPAYVLGHDPTQKIVVASYSDALAAKHHNDCRAVLRSQWYQRIFPATRVSTEKNSESEFMTTRRGGRLATSVGGTLTGRGGNLIIIDDPMKPEEAYSEAARTRVSHWFDNTLFSRLNDKNEDAIIVVMQRLHVDDLAGVLLQKGGWELLELQAIAENEQEILIGPDETFRRAIGEVLHPARESRATLDSIKAAMGSSDFSAQYQQRPVPLEGGMIKRKWLKYYDTAPTPQSDDTIVISWDTASKASELASYSVGTVWLCRKNIYYLLDLVRGRYDFPTLKRAVATLKARWPGSSLLIEDTAAGIGLLQEMRASGYPAIGIKPTVDKTMRLFTVQSLFEAGAVFFPKQANWLEDLIEELLAFPNYRSDDQVDSISQALNWIQKRRRSFDNGDIGGPPVLIPNENAITLTDWSDYYE